MKDEHKTDGILVYLLPRTRDVIFFVMFLAVVVMGPRILNVDGDLGRHLTVGKYIVTNQRIPTRDIFSHTMYGAALTPHEWLAEVLFSLSNEVAGLTGVVLISAILIASTFMFLYQQCLDSSKSVLWSLLFTLLAAAASSLHWLARPHLFTMLLVVLWMKTLKRMNKDEGKGWLVLPLLMLVWVNLHGAFIAGFVILIMFFAGEFFDDVILDKLSLRAFLFNSKALILGTLTSFFVTLANPVGFHIWETSLGFLKNSYLVDHTAEYFSPNFHQVSTYPFLLFILISMGILYLERRRIRTANLILMLAWIAMALISVRNVPLYVLIAAPMLVEMWVHSLGQLPLAFKMNQFDDRLREIEEQVHGWIVVVIGLLVVVWMLLLGIRLDIEQSGNVFSKEVFPVDAVNWLESSHIRGKMFNYFPWGGYLLYRLWPDQQVFIDGQTDFYGEDLTREYETVISLDDGWEDVLEKYNVGWVIVPVDSLLARELQKMDGWQQVYRDNTTVIFNWY